MSEPTAIPARILNAVAPFAGKADPRYYLNGLHLTVTDDGALRIQATDGHTLARYDVPDFQANGSPPAQVFAVPKLPAREDVTLGARYEGEKQALEIRSSSQTWTVPEIGGKYPDCDRVIPAEIPVECSIMAPVSLQPHFIERVGKAFTEIGKAVGAGTVAVRLESGTDSSRCVRCTADTLPGFAVVVMPVRAQTAEARAAEEEANKRRKAIIDRLADSEKRALAAA